MIASPTLLGFREAVHTLIVGALPALPVHPDLPDDIAELPCAVVGLPSWDEAEPAVNELKLDLWLIARRQSAGGAEAELLGWAQQMIDAFGGTRRTVDVGGVQVHMTDGASRVIDIAGQRCLAYQMTITAAAVGC